jgi:hypothetical protein
MDSDQSPSKSKSSLEDLSAYNPAVTAPASSTLTNNLQSESRKKEEMNRNEGDPGEPRLPTPLSKYEVGWRRVVRNFSPS